MAKSIIRSAKHLAFIRTLPCIRTGRLGVDAAHIRKGTDGGIGIKPSDCWVVPLCSEQHRRQHQIGELSFFKNMEAVRALALELYEHTGDKSYCLELINNYRSELVA